MTKPSILCINEDSLASPGSAVIQEVAGEFGSSVTTVVPAGPQAFTAHRRIVHRPLSLDTIDKGVYILNGTPVDCVRIAKQYVVPKAELALVGVVRGSTLGNNVFTSAAVAAACEAASLGLVSIVISQSSLKGEPIVWKETHKLIRRVLKFIWQQPHTDGAYWNVNLPRFNHSHLPDIVFRSLDPSPLTFEYEERGEAFLFKRQFHKRPHRVGYDVQACRGGDITITKLSIKSPWLQSKNADAGAAAGHSLRGSY
jgi:5'-nucleotidase